MLAAWYSLTELLSTRLLDLAFAILTVGAVMPLARHVERFFQPLLDEFDQLDSGRLLSLETAPEWDSDVEVGLVNGHGQQKTYFYGPRKLLNRWSRHYLMFPARAI